MTIIKANGMTESGARLSGTVVSMGPMSLTVATELGTRVMYRDAEPRLFCRALGGVIDWNTAQDSI